MGPDPYSIYCDWGFHDELGDRVELDEAMTLTALDTLAAWRERHGVGFDYYLIDCFWFDPARPYTDFKADAWPRGFEPALGRIRDLGMTPGLWYATNADRLNKDVPEIRESLDGGGWFHSLVDGPYAARLEEAWRMAIDRWGVRFFKLDFAHLEATAPDADRGREETYRLAVKRLKEIFRRLKRHCPELRVLTHCNWPRIADKRPWGPQIYDASWLEVMDRMFTGDPRPAETPSTDITRSMDLYQDHQTWAFHQSGMPLDRLDDHGVMIGTTNTLFYRGRHGFRRSHLGQLARGGRRDMFYGNPTLLSDRDVVEMKQTRELFFDAYRRGLRTVMLGGRPGVAPWHAFLTGGGDAGLLYLANGTLATQRAAVTIPGLFRAAVLFQDGPDAPAVQVQPDRLSLDLLPEQMVLIGLGDYAEVDRAVGGNADSPQAREMRPLGLTWRPTPGYGLEAELAPLPRGRQVYVSVEARDAGPAGPLESRPKRFASQNTRHSDDMSPHTHEVIRITAEAGGRAVESVRRVPEVPVHGGMSWVGKLFDLPDGGRLRVEQCFDDGPVRLIASAYAVQW